MTASSFNYDVAFSFLAADELIAQKLSDLLRDRYGTFIYTERQRELAGRDGEQKFAEVFGKEARSVVVLYRDGWGESPWTRPEQEAIRDRARDVGYDFTLFIATTPGPTLPRWLPRNRIWFNLERWGIEAAAAVIDAHIQSQGGEGRLETAVERAARLKRSLEAEKWRVGRRNSSQGVADATGAFMGIVGIIEEWAQEPTAKDLGIRPFRSEYALQLSRPHATLMVVWHNRIINSLDEAELEASIWDPAPAPPGYLLFEKPRRVCQRTLMPDFDGSSGEVIWREKGSNVYRSAAIADDLIRWYMDQVELRTKNKR